MDTMMDGTVMISLDEYRRLLRKEAALEMLRESIMNNLARDKGVYMAINDDLVYQVTETTHERMIALNKEVQKINGESVRTDQ